MSKRTSTYSGYEISQGYTSVTVYSFGKMTNSLVSVSRCFPDKKLSRFNRYTQIVNFLMEYFDFAPCYRPTKKEKQETLKRLGKSES